MQILDWIFIAALVLGLVLGILKGFLKPLLSAIGFVIVAFGASLLAPAVQGWMMGIKMNDDIRPLVAIVLSAVGLVIIWVLLAFLLRKIITKRKGMGILNRVIGAVLGLLIVYLVFAVIVAYIAGPLGGITPFITDKLRPDVEESWIRQHIYTDKGNFFGNWVIGSMARKLLEIIQGGKDAMAAILSIRAI